MCVLKSWPRNGVVDDILIRLDSLDDSTRWIFYPAVQVDDTKFLSSDPPVPADALKGLVATFYPVSVPGKQSQVASYLFIPMLKHPNFPFGQIKPHTFRVSVITRSDGNVNLVTQQVFTDVLSDVAIAQIKTGAVYQQFPDELDQLRRDIK